MSKKEESKIMSKDSRKRLQKDIIDIIKNPLTEHGIYYTHDDSDMLKGYAVIFGEVKDGHHVRQYVPFY